jgi:amidase
MGDVFFQQLGIEGPMGRCIEDVAQLLNIQVGSDIRAPLSRQSNNNLNHHLSGVVKGKRIAWLGNMNAHLAIDIELSHAYEKAINYFFDIGCSVEAKSLKIDLNAVWLAWLTLRGLTVAGNLSPIAANPAMRDLLKPEAIWEYEQGLRYSALDVYRASSVRSALLGAFLALFETVDYIVLPATQCMPFDIELDWPKTIAGRTMDTYHRWMECTIYATLSGLPALVVPAGLVGGLPFGLQIIGKPSAEIALLELGLAWQQVIPKVSAIDKRVDL